MRVKNKSTYGYNKATWTWATFILFLTKDLLDCKMKDLQADWETALSLSKIIPALQTLVKPVLYASSQPLFQSFYKYALRIFTHVPAHNKVSGFQCLYSVLCCSASSQMCRSASKMDTRGWRRTHTGGLKHWQTGRPVGKKPHKQLSYFASIKVHTFLPKDIMFLHITRHWMPHW